MKQVSPFTELFRKGQTIFSFPSFYRIFCSFDNMGNDSQLFFFWIKTQDRFFFSKWAIMPFISIESDRVIYLQAYGTNCDKTIYPMSKYATCQYTQSHNAQFILFFTPLIIRLQISVRITNLFSNRQADNLITCLVVIVLCQKPWEFEGRSSAARLEQWCSS